MSRLRESSINPRYEPLPASDNDVPAQAHDETAGQPPSYKEVTEHPNESESVPGPTDTASSPAVWEYKSDHTVFIPPSYEAATTLPSYRDVEHEKEQEARMEVVDQIFGLSADEPDLNEPRLDGVVIGNDCLFFFAFLVAFFFNWIGLFIGYFIMYNLAGRYGAMAGFGTSMIKWLIYLKYSKCCKDYFLNDHEYVWWIFNFLAFVILIKGIVNWLTVRKFRYMSTNTLDQNAQYMLFE